MTLLNERRVRLRAAVLCVGGATLLLHCGTRETESLIPAELGGLKRTKDIRGEEARGMINRLHGGVIAPQENAIGFYEGQGLRATLYVSVYAERGDASAVDSTMERRINAGNPVFGNLRTLIVAGHKLSECTGMGQVHYFFSCGNRVYWLGVDDPVAERAVKGLLSACNP